MIRYEKRHEKRHENRYENRYEIRYEKRHRFLPKDLLLEMLKFFTANLPPVEHCVQPWLPYIRFVCAGTVPPLQDPSVSLHASQGKD